MDLDLAQIQAFVAVAEHRHITRAAANLYVTPQAVSKRIIRLEARLSERLFLRTGRSVECTAFGHRLLPLAQELLAAADALATTVNAPGRALRIDVWDLVPAPMHALQLASEVAPGLEIEVTSRRSLGDAATALLRREIDAAFGRVQDLAAPLADELRHQLVLLQPITIAVLADHPLAAGNTVDTAELRDWGIWWPLGERSTEVMGYARRFSEHFGVPVDTTRRGVGPVGPVDPIDRLREDPATVVACTTGWPSPPSIDVRCLVLDPMPLFPWSLIWRRHDRDPALRRMTEAVVQRCEQDGWLAYDTEQCWLPAVDAAALA